MTTSGSKLAWIALGIGVTCIAGCSGDLAKMIGTNPAMRDKVITAIGANLDASGQMVDRLVAADSTRLVVVNHLLANGPGAQEVLAHVAKDRTMVDGVINLAVQDSVMRDHVLTLLQGMQMAEHRH